MLLILVGAFVNQTHLKVKRFGLTRARLTLDERDFPGLPIELDRCIQPNHANDDISISAPLRKQAG